MRDHPSRSLFCLIVCLAGIAELGSMPGSICSLGISYEQCASCATINRPIIPMAPIESTRLLITTWSKDDLPAAKKLWGDPEVMRYVDRRGGVNADQVREKLREEMDRQEQWGVQYWKVILKNTRQTIGCCGLRPYDLANRVYELGFHFMKPHWGRGYAQEAAKAVIDYAFEVMRVPKFFAGHNPENLASAPVLTKLGFQGIAELFYAPTGRYHPSYELARQFVESAFIPPYILFIFSILKDIHRFMKKLLDRN